jgi:hypothetical protein
MALVPIKTSSGTGYCDCICGCYDLVSLRDEETGKGYCPRCAKEHLEMNRGVGLPQPPPSKLPEGKGPIASPHTPEPADPPGRLR